MLEVVVEAPFLSSSGPAVAGVWWEEEGPLIAWTLLLMWLLVTSAVFSSSDVSAKIMIPQDMLHLGTIT